MALDVRCTCSLPLTLSAWISGVRDAIDKPSGFSVIGYGAQYGYLNQIVLSALTTVYITIAEVWQV